MAASMDEKGLWPDDKLAFPGSQAAFRESEGARVEEELEAASGFEPLHRGFADLSLNHLGTPPLSDV